MTQIQHNQLVSFIWNIANDVLVNVYNKGDYRKVILPMIVLRRFDAVLEDTKKEVLAMKERLTAANTLGSLGFPFLFFVLLIDSFNCSSLHSFRYAPRKRMNVALLS